MSALLRALAESLGKRAAQLALGMLLGGRETDEIRLSDLLDDAARQRIARLAALARAADAVRRASATPGQSHD